MRLVVRPGLASWVLVGLMWGIAAPLSSQERALPDQQAFMAEARKRLQPDEMRQSGYVYKETRHELKLDSSGKTTKEEVSIFESYPALPNEFRWKRLIQKNGVPVSQAELDKQDRERQKKVMAYVKKREENPAKAAAEQAKKAADERREVDQGIDDALIVYDFKMLGRETLAGHDTIVFSFTPKKNAKPRTRDGKIMQKFAGKAWVSESEYRAGAPRGRGPGDGVVRAWPPGPCAQGLEGVLRAAQGERRGVAAGVRHLPGQRPRGVGEGASPGRRLGVFGLPEVRRGHRDNGEDA